MRLAAHESLLRGLRRYFEFLQLYVSKKVPTLAPLNAIAPVLGSTIWGVDTFAPFEDRFAGDTYDAALAAFEAEPSIRIGFEQGGNAAYSPGTPEPNFVAEFPSWPIPSAAAATWLLDGDGTLTDGPLAKPGESTYIRRSFRAPRHVLCGGREQRHLEGDVRTTEADPRRDRTSSSLRRLLPQRESPALVPSTGIESPSADTDLEQPSSRCALTGRRSMCRVDGCVPVNGRSPTAQQSCARHTPISNPTPPTCLQASSPRYASSCSHLPIHSVRAAGCG